MHVALLNKLLYGRRWMVISSIAASGFTIAIALWWNMQLSQIIDRVSGGIRPSAPVIIQAIATMLILALSSFFKSYIASQTCEYMAHDLRMGYARHYSALAVAQAEQLQVGEELSKLQNEIAGVSQYLSGSLFQLIDDFFRFTATFTWLLLLNPLLTAAANLPVLVILAYVIFASKIIGVASQCSQQAKGEMNRHADNLVTLFPIIRLYDAASMVKHGYQAAVGAWLSYHIRTERIRARLMSLSALLSHIPLLLLFFIGGHMVINDALSIGTLYVFLNLSGNVSGVMMNMPGHIAAFRQFTANIHRLSAQVLLEGESV